MKVLVIGGTQFMGVHLVRNLIKSGDDITIATRGKTPDPFGHNVTRITLDRTDGETIKYALAGLTFDVIYDTQAYCSNEIKMLLDVVTTRRYIQVSTLSVYFEDLKPQLQEHDYDPHTRELIWCNRTDFHYGIIKQQAENAIFQAYPHIDAVAVRFPYVIGVDDYTKRLLFYVEHIVKGQKMHIDNLETEFAFVNSQEAGEFLAWLGGQDFTGPINAASYGTNTLKEIIDYIENQTGKKAIIGEDGAKAPYNGTPSYSLDLSTSKENGFTFSDLTDWLYPLLDALIENVEDKSLKFDGKAQNYDTGRPSYPSEAVTYILEKANEKTVIADIGAGTGKLTTLLAKNGNSVIAVEPSEDMFDVLVKNMAEFSNVKAFCAIAEATSIEDNSVDILTVAQALHWFDLEKFKLECRRILKPQGQVFVLYNNAVDAKIEIVEKANHRMQAVHDFFVDPIKRDFAYEIKYDRETWLSFMLSHSYSPLETDENYQQFIDEMNMIFDDESENSVLTRNLLTTVWTGEF